MFASAKTKICWEKRCGPLKYSQHEKQQDGFNCGPLVLKVRINTFPKLVFVNIISLSNSGNSTFAARLNFLNFKKFRATY